MVDGGLIRVCASAALADGQDGIRFNVREAGQVIGAFVVRHQGRVVGYLNRCAHVGLELDWVEGRFFDADRRWLMCATHGALYEPHDGRCAAGACEGRGGLRALTVLERDGAVYWRVEPGLDAA